MPDWLLIHLAVYLAAEILRRYLKLLFAWVGMQLILVIVRPVQAAFEAAVRRTTALLSLGVLAALAALCVFLVLRYSQPRRACPA